MKIGWKILIGLILSIGVAYIAARIKGEIPFVEGASGLLVFILPIISIAIVIGLESPKERTSKALISVGVIFAVLLVVGLMFV